MKQENLAPVLLFAYNRLDTLKRTVAALQKNCLAKESNLYIFSDAAKVEKDVPIVKEVRRYLNTISGFRNVYIIEALRNKGLANSIITGVTEIINKYGKVIVLEDDLVTSSNFLSYMNQTLCYYADNPNVFTVSGFSFVIDGLTEKDIYFSRRSTSWGWATWRNRWKDIDWDVKCYSSFVKDMDQRKAFNQMGSDMALMLDRQMRGEIDSWAIRWNFHQFQQQTYSVHPGVSKVQNIGFVKEATNTRDVSSRYATILDTSANQEFLFTENVQMVPSVIKQYVRHFSVLNRLKYKVINKFYLAYKMMVPG